MRLLIAVFMVIVLIHVSQADEDFDYFTNSWSLIGLKDYTNVTRVTPENKLLLGNNAAVEICFGKDLVPLGKQHTKRLLDGWLPIILLKADDEGVSYKFTL